MKYYTPLLFLSYIIFSNFLWSQAIDTSSYEYIKIDSLYQQHIKNLENREYPEAKANAEKALNLFNKNYPQKSNELKAKILESVSEYQDTAEDNFKMKLEALEIYSEKPEKYISERVTVLYKLANSYFLMTDYKKSLDYCAQTLKLLNSYNLGQNNIDAVNKLILRNYDRIFHDAYNSYDHKKALSTLDKIKSMVLETKGKNSFDYSQTLANYAQVYILIGDNSRAIPLMQESLNIKSELLGENHRSVIRQMKNISSIYDALGSYDKALKMLNEVYEKELSNYNEISIEPLSTLQYTAYVYLNTNQIDKAQEKILTAIERSERILGPEHPMTITLNIDRANFYVLENKIKKAKEILDQLETQINNLKPEEKSKTLSSTTFIHIQLKEYDKALQKQQKALELIFNEDDLTYDPEKISILSNIANLHQLKNNYQEALNTEVKISNILASHFGETGSAYYSSIFDRIIFNLKLKNYKKADELLSLYNSYLLERLESYFMVLTSQEKEKFTKELINHNLKLYTLYNYLNDDANPQNASAALNNVLISKGLVLRANVDVLNKIEALNLDDTNNTIAQFRSLKASISKQLQLPIDQREEDFNEKVKSLEKIESEIVARYREYFKDDLDIKKNWKDTNLKGDELAIEFTSFYDYDKPKSSKIYAAYLYKKNWESPKIIILFEEEELAKHFINSTSPNQLYSKRGSKATSKKINQHAADSIYNLVWKPLESYVSESSKTYFSPDGLLHKIAFSALPNNDGKMIGEIYNIQRVSNTADIRKSNNIPDINDLLLIGGVDYSFTPNDKNEVVEKNQYSMLESDLLLGDNQNRSIAPNGFSYLEGTSKEVAQIKNLLPDSKSLTGKNANETSFKKLSGNSPSVLHIATHGFFFPKAKTPSNTLTEKNSNPYNAATNPLLRSGIILANANYAWQNGKNQYLEDDGILTALEISNLDLRKTDLVVLSACETGLGDIDNSEGVYGLQRAFKMAGVKTIIMSLWEVPDKETSEFMQLFYSNWKSLNNPKKAFIDTQKMMMKKYKDTPEKWAAFVLFE